MPDALPPADSVLPGDPAAPLPQAVVERDFDAVPPLPRPVPVLRTLVTGALMGTANLVPGVSGGTMVLVCGLYAHFVDAAADATRLKAGRQAVLFLVLLFAAKFAAMGLLGVPVAQAVVAHRMLAYSLFLGMTLAGTPVLWRILRKRAPARRPWLAWALLPVGALAVATLALAPRHAPPAAGLSGYRPDPNVPLDFVAGAAAYGAMVLPGVSGGTVKLALGRYEPTVWSIGQAGNWINPTAHAVPPGDWLSILLPYAAGAVVGLVLVSNLLKRLLARHERPMAGLLLGVLWGSVAPIWPFHADAGPADYAVGLLAAAGGFAAVYALTLWKGAAEHG